MTRAVRFDHYGDVDVLRIDEVERPVPAADQVLVEVVAAGINPGEASIRSGLLHERWPVTFPSGQGSDFAGRVVETGGRSRSSRSATRCSAGRTGDRRRPITSWCRPTT
ncbi:alcohol dehydrogenase catalytic domain-containing protein [Paractinoplanes hotanensis]|uniref:alcohol dehydrogenase catalytic domain-containing protein n=1 Tax=Paractinoplanes hotanensis TaxID=2906497 RepID=UPI003F68FD70